MTQVGRERETRGVRGQLTALDSEVFDKWAQSLSSIAEIVEWGVQHLVRRYATVPRIAFIPVLVVPDGTLWGAKYSENGRIEGDPTAESEIMFYIGRKYHINHQADLVVTHLHIYTLSAVRDLLSGVVNGGGIWQQLFPSTEEHG